MHTDGKKKIKFPGRIRAQPEKLVLDGAGMTTAHAVAAKRAGNGRFTALNIGPVQCIIPAMDGTNIA